MRDALPAQFLAKRLLNIDTVVTGVSGLVREHQNLFSWSRLDDLNHFLEQMPVGMSRPLPSVLEASEGIFDGLAPCLDVDEMDDVLLVRFDLADVLGSEDRIRVHDDATVFFALLRQMREQVGVVSCVQDGDTVVRIWNDDSKAD